MALGFKYFTSADAGAPLLTPVAGSLTDVLDWVLDVGNAVTGWETVFTATNKRVYRSRYGIRDFFRIDDSPGGGSALVRAYESMSDIDTGTDPYPLISQSPLANGKWSHTFATTGVQAWDYYGIKTARFMMLIRPSRRSPEVPTGLADVLLMGEIPKFPGTGTDNHTSLLSVHNTSGTPSADFGIFSGNASSGANRADIGCLGLSSPTTVVLAMRRNRAGNVFSMPCRVNVLNATQSFTLSSNLHNEPMLLTPVGVGTGQNANNETIRNVRGYLPGLYVSSLDLDTVWNKGDTFTDAAGRPYVYLRSTATSAGGGSVLVLGTTDEHGAV